MLARIYAELDLVAAECIRAGVFAGLTGPQLAAVLASLVYEARRSDDGCAPAPDAGRGVQRGDERGAPDLARGVAGRAGRPAAARSGAGHRLQRGRRTAGRPAGRCPTVLADTELTAGDFVRWIRQVVDFAGQIADAAGPGELRDVARRMVHSMRRGVVTYSAEDDDADDITGADLP